MAYKDFSEDTLDHIQSVVQKIQKQTNQPLVAAFDADGTLWDADVGELFFRHQARRLCIDVSEFFTKNDDYLCPHQSREAILKVSHINVGYRLSQIRQWAMDCYEQHKQTIHVFRSQKRLISHLQRLGIHVFIVTASCKWAIEPFGRLFFNIGSDHIIGTEMHVEDNIVTGQPKQLTYNEGKVKGLLEATGGIKPILAVGNALPDEHLLHLATHIKLVVQSKKKDSGDLYKSEQQLKSIALQQGIEKGWLHHQFYD